MINKQEKMPYFRDCSSALHLLEHIQQTINNTDDVQLQMQTNDDLNMLISVFNNPIMRTVVSVDESLGELNQQLQQHPSILPVDLFVSPTGELSLNVVPPDDVYDSHYDEKYLTRREFDDQTVPSAMLSNSSSTDTSTSPQLGTPGTTNGTLPPITTQTYAIEFQKAIEEASRGRDIFNVQLYKPEGSSLGFSVVGLRSEEKGELGIFVQDIQNSGIAGRDGNLREGDQILAIDGQPLDSNISHQQAISILQKARGLVELVVARGAEEETQQIPSPVARSPSAVSDSSKAGSDMVLNTEWSQVEVIDLVNDGSGLGFGIIGGRSTGVVVKTILPGGVADRDGRLQSGDHILQIGDVNLRGMGSEQVAAVLRQSGSHVRLVVARPVEPTSPDYQALGSHAPIVPTKILGDPEELDRHLLQNGYTEALTRRTPVFEAYNENLLYREHQSDIELNPQATLVIDAVRNPVGPSLPLITAPSLSVLTMDMLPTLETADLPEMEKFTVELKKDHHGLGITIAGYVCEKEELSGIFVKSISEGSAADVCKKIQVNDRIVEVDGRSLQGYTNHQAVEVLRSTGQTVKLCLERYLRGPKFEQLQQAIAASELKLPTPSSPAVSLPRLPISTDADSIVDGEIEREPQVLADSIRLENVEATNLNVDIRDLEMLIDNDYEGPLKPTVEAAIQAKWNKILGNDSEIIVAQLCKLSEGGGLGISLEGTVDVEHGQEVRPHHYIRSILPDGPVGRNGRLRSGDELLEVNGYRLLGMNHIEVVSILKDLAMSVRMVCARRNGDTLPHTLLENSQDKAAFAARNILGGSLQNLIPATDRLVKAKSDGSLASTTITATATDGSFSKMKSRSLEPLTGLAMWSSEPQIIELVKGERGLGFSILDYQDPMNPNETVIVIRSLVPGGVAQIDGQLIPGDRLVFVNDTNLENASLDQAVQALKGAPKGIVRIGVAKPLPIPDSVSHCQKGSAENSDASPTIDDQSMFSSCESLSPQPQNDDKTDEKKSEQKVEKEKKSGGKKKSSGKLETEKDSEKGHLEREIAEEEKRKKPDPVEETEEDLSADLLQQMVPVAMDRAGGGRTSSFGDTTDDDLDDDEFQTGWAADVVHLPPSIEVEIRVHKGTEPLGISVDSVDRGINGMLVVLVVPGGAVARDGHIHPGDYLVSVNHETLRKVTNSQARAILRRAQLLSSDISVTYIPEEAAIAYKKSIRQDSHSSVESSPVAAIRRTSPRSPYFPSDSSVESSDERDKDNPVENRPILGSSPLATEGLIKPEPLLEPQATVATTGNADLPKPLVVPIISARDAKLGLSQTFTLKYETLPCTELPSNRAPREVCPSNVRKLSQTKSADGDAKHGPLSICVVDGLYSVHSPKGNKVLVGIELSRKDKFQSVNKDKRLVSSSPQKKSDGTDDCEFIPLKDINAPSQDVKHQRNSNTAHKPPVRGGSLDVRIHSEFPKSNARFHRASLVETIYDSTKLVCDETGSRRDVDNRNKVNGIKEKSAEEVKREPEKSNTDSSEVKKEIEIAKGRGGEESDTEVVTVKNIDITVTTKDDEDILTVSSSESQDLKSKRKVIQTRIPSFECTCEVGALDDASPEQICTCASPSAPQDAFLDVFSDTSKRSSYYHSAEIAVHTTEVGSNQTSQELTVNQEMANTESIFSSGEEFKSGATSPFYSPRGDSPEGAPSSKNSVKMDKEVSANILLAKHWGPERQVEVVREPNCSLGISIVGGKVDLYNAGPDSSSAILGIFIKNVLPNSPAGLTRELKTGDRILEVDSIDLRSASHERAVEVIRGAGTRVRFLVQSLIQWNIEGNSEPTSSNTLPPNETELERFRPPSPRDSVRTPEPVVIQEGVDDLRKQVLQEEKRKFSAGSLDIEPDFEFVDSIKINVEEYDDDDDVDMIINSEVDVNDADEDDDENENDEEEEEVEDDDDGDIDDDDDDDDNVDNDEDEEENDDEEVEEADREENTEFCLVEGEELTTEDKERTTKTGDNINEGIDGKRAADSDEPDEFGYTLSKVKKKYESLGDTVLIVHLEKSHKGLGISLAGHKDRNRMAVFVCGINPNGVAFKTGGIEVGDEILEVNGIVLRGRCHLNASAIIKGLPGPSFKVIILRRASALQDLAVKPITQFPISLDDEPPEQKYAKFRGVKTVTIKKGNQNLGIMIIEGKHAEVGQGIFISDIQEGSSAEQAGLTIGDMILAVNKDTLLGANYDTAATLLKKTEGLVTLVVCNPNKGKEENKGMTTVGSTPNRSPTPTAKEPEKSRLISFSGLKPLKSISPSKQLVEGSSGESRPSHSMLTASSPPYLPTTEALTPKTSPALSLRKSSSGKLADQEPLPDPLTCPIVPSKETLIEINKEKLPLGISVIGGCDTLMGVTIIHEIYPDSAAAKDGRLQPGDHILEVNGEDLSVANHVRAQTALRQTPSKVKMLVYRDESITKENLLQTTNVELFKKPGKGLGLSITAKKDGSQVFISEIVHGGLAELDGRLMKGDYILEVNGISLKDVSQDTAAAILKSSSGKIVIKIGRIRCKKRLSSSNVRDPLFSSSIVDINGSSVRLNGVGDPDAEGAFVNGCFHTSASKTSTIRNFVRSLSMRRRNEAAWRLGEAEGKKKKPEKSGVEVEKGSGVPRAPKTPN